MKKNIEKLKKSINEGNFKFKERHVMWNWQYSSNSYEDKKLVRYHIVITDDRFIEEKLERIMLNFQNKSIITHSFDEIRRLEGKFKDTGLDYLFVSFDTQYPYSYLSFEGVSKNVKRYKDLREREGLSIEDYVRRIYE
jgi:hypothetical protein